MKLEILPDLIVSSFVLGGAYTLIALGWVIIYRATQVLNFASGQFSALGSFLFYWLLVTLGLPFLVSAFGAVALIALVGILIYFVMLRPLAGQPIWSPVIMTLGLSTALTNLMALVWGSGSFSLPPPIPSQVYSFGTVRVLNLGLAIVVLALVVYLGFIAFSRFSRLGIQMRAAAERPLLASQSGININLLFALGWGISGVVALLAGVTYSYTTILSMSISSIALRGLAPALIGGLDSIEGVVLGAFLVALLENFGVTLFGGAARDATVFAVLLVMLALRPYGFFGTPEVRRV